MIEVTGKRIKVKVEDKTIVEGIAEEYSDDSGSDVLIRILEEESTLEVGTIRITDGAVQSDIY